MSYQTIQVRFQDPICFLRSLPFEGLKSGLSTRLSPITANLEKVRSRSEYFIRCSVNIGTLISQVHSLQLLSFLLALIGKNKRLTTRDLPDKFLFFQFIKRFKAISYIGPKNFSPGELRISSSQPVKEIKTNVNSRTILLFSFSSMFIFTYHEIKSADYAD